MRPRICLPVIGVWLLCVFFQTAAAQTRTKNVILITADGLRWQELFTGIDPLLMKEEATGMAKADELRRKLWRDNPEDRRSELMPFFWKTLAPSGVVLGNIQKNSPVKVTNSYRVSYPGYSEILTGRAQDESIKGNSKIQNPTPTVLEFVRSRLGLRREQVALFASWEVFQYIGESEPGSVYINTGYQSDSASERMKELSALQFQMRSPWDSVRHDHVTLEMALDHMRREKPRFLYISLGEMDDWAHDRRYDRTLTSIQYFDEALRRVWSMIEQTPEYRGSTSIVITADHGRGSKLDDWHGHGAKIDGADAIWFAAFGPGIPAMGEVSNSAAVFQRDVAPTILELLGIRYQDYAGVQGHPISLVLPSAAARQQ